MGLTLDGFASYLLYTHFCLAANYPATFTIPTVVLHFFPAVLQFRTGLYIADAVIPDAVHV
jgi:hypothetical protein